MADVTTGDRRAAALPVRAQPVGTFPLPAGFLLVPPGDDTEAARTALLAGRIPDPWPATMRAHELAMAGELDAALAELTGDDPVSRYNRFVIDPDADDPAELRDALGPEFGVLVDLVCFTLGRTDRPPAAEDATGELRALVLAAQATQAVTKKRPTEAVERLCEAAGHALPVAPPLAGVLLGAAATIRKDAEGPGPHVVTTLRRALTLLADTDLTVGQAELQLTLALTLHELAGENRDHLAAAVKHYHATLQLITADQAPEVFAAAHANLATAYLTMPMVEASDQLRLGVAVQSLRAALTVYLPETHPREWASAQLNLANALVYTPSTHQGDNLVEAVELYESVLEARDRDSDPLGRARVLANQGNALAHLGIFDQAKAKLYEARFLFEEFQDVDSVRTVRDLLDEIARQTMLAKTEG